MAVLKNTPSGTLNQAPIRVAVVHAEKLVRLGLRSALEHDGMAAVVAESESPEAVERQLRTEEGTVVVVMHLVVPVQPMLDAVERLRRLCPGAHVLAVGALTAGLACMAAQAGVRGLLSCTVCDVELRQAVTTLAGGGLHANAWMLEQVTGTGRTAVKEVQRHRIKLSTMQAKVLRLICHPDGHTYKQIAHQLKLSPRTVHSHRNTLFRKFGVDRKEALIIKAKELRYF